MKLLLLFLITVSALGETLTWDNNPASDQVTAYKVYWSTNATAPMPWTLISTVSTNASPGSTNTLGRNYYYVTAWNGSESDPSDIAFRPVKTGHVKVNP